MLGEYTNDFSVGNRGRVEYVRSNLFDLIAKLLKLGTSIVGMSFPAVACQINESGRAYRASYGQVSIKHGKFVGHAFRVVTHVGSPYERHRHSPKIPKATKLRGFTAFVERVGKTNHRQPTPAGEVSDSARLGDLSVAARNHGSNKAYLAGGKIKFRRPLECSITGLPNVSFCWQ
jgi:hypothetical protein